MCMDKTTHMVWNMTKQFVYMQYNKIFHVQILKTDIVNSVVLYFIKIVLL